MGITEKLDSVNLKLSCILADKRISNESDYTLFKTMFELMHVFVNINQLFKNNPAKSHPNLLTSHKSLRKFEANYADIFDVKSQSDINENWQNTRKKYFLCQFYKNQVEVISNYILSHNILKKDSAKTLASFIKSAQNKIKKALPDMVKHPRRFPESSDKNHNNKITTNKSINNITPPFYSQRGSINNNSTTSLKKPSSIETFKFKYNKGGFMRETTNKKTQNYRPGGIIPY